MILSIMLIIITCFVIYFLKAKRYKTKRLVISIVGGGLLRSIQSYIKGILEVGVVTILFRKVSNRLRQPYFSKNGIVKYEFNGKNYNVVVKRLTAKKVKPQYFILESKDGSGVKTDVTSQLEPWIGPEHNFHNSYITPSDLGYTKLIVVFSLGDKLVVEKDDPLPTKLIK
jgi:Family of unknown function (DUF5772)